MHFFTVSDRHYCFDQLSGTCYKIDDVSEAALRAWVDSDRKMSPKDIEYCLVKGGFSGKEAKEAAADIEEYASTNSRCLLVEQATPRRLRGLELHVSHACNLGCGYCFAGKGSYGSPSTMMTEKVAYSAIDNLVNQADPSDELNIVFFGGEPLLNKSLIADIFSYVSDRYPDRHFSYSITTNGTLLDEEIVRLLESHHVSTLVSMDGIGEKHDISRPYKDGRGSFEDIKCRVERFGDSIPLGVRATLTKGNHDVLADLEAFEDMGFRKAYFSPVSTDDGEIALDQASLQEVRVGLERLAEEYFCIAQKGHSENGSGRPVFRGLENLMRAIKSRTLANVGCGAGRRFVAVTPTGEYFPCHRYVGMPVFSMGDIETDVDKGRFEENWDMTTESREDCRICWLQQICGGGCEWEAAAQDGLQSRCLYPSSCDYRRMAYEIAFDLLYRLEGVKDESQVS